METWNKQQHTNDERQLGAEKNIWVLEYTYEPRHVISNNVTF